MKIDRAKLLKLYLQEVDKICDECDWKTHFEPSEIIGIVANLLENNSDLEYHSIRFRSIFT